jgi:hypothetical protein
MKNYLLILMVLLPWLSKAQEMDYPGHPLSLQLQGGTQGVGADLRYGLFRQLSIRAGASFIPVTVNNVFSFPGVASQNSVSAKFSNAHLWADIVPFAGLRGLRLVGGAGYLFRANGGMVVTPTGNYNYGDIVVTPAQIGNLNLDVSWKGVAPYIGLGLFRSFPSRFFNFNLDVGTYYLTSPQATVVGTGLLSGNDVNGAIITGNVSQYRWLPVVQLNFNFRLHK